jgi:hypothetical protein
MTSEKRHRRWSEATETSPAFFPKDKYGFTEYLTRVGDFVRTHPMSYEDRIKFKKAAHDWAWHKRYKVRVNAYRKGDDVWEMECTLTSKVFGRDFL